MHSIRIQGDLGQQQGYLIDLRLVVLKNIKTKFKLKSVPLESRLLLVKMNGWKGKNFQNCDALLHCTDVPTMKCPMKHMKRIIERMRKAIPKEIPRIVVLKKRFKFSFNLLQV